MAEPARDSIGELPGLLQEVADAAGLQAALDLAKACGGTIVYIPAKLSKNDTVLTRAVGRRAAAEICKLRPGENVPVPLGPMTTDAQKRVKVKQLLDEGLSIQEIVRRTAVHRATVYRVRDQQADDRQGDLF